MPLTKGKSPATVSRNIKTLVHEYDDSGAIGTSHPRTRKKAIRQAVAIALDTARKTGGRRHRRSGR